MIRHQAVGMHVMANFSNAFWDQEEKPAPNLLT